MIRRRKNSRIRAGRRAPCIAMANIRPQTKRSKNRTPPTTGTIGATPWHAAGQLQQALQAYGQALKLQPEHADARANKDLVEKALRQQQQPQQNNAQPPQSKNQQKSPQDQQSRPQQSPQGQQDGGKQPENAQGSGKDQSQPSPQAGGDHAGQNGNAGSTAENPSAESAEPAPQGDQRGTDPAGTSQAKTENSDKQNAEPDSGQTVRQKAGKQGSNSPDRGGGGRRNYRSAAAGEPAMAARHPRRPGRLAAT